MKNYLLWSVPRPNFSIINCIQIVQMRAKIWDNISDEAKDLVMKMLAHDQNERLTAHEALQHPWLKVRSKAPVSQPVNRKC